MSPEENQKYFRTPHTPWSRGATSDDKRVASVLHFVGQEIVVTEKVDGENQTWTDTSVYARFHATPVHHASSGWSKMLHAERKHLIDPGLSVFLEYTFALHSIWYGRMAREYAYAHVFGVRDDHTGEHWCWEDVEVMASVLGLPTVPVLWRGVLMDEAHLLRLMPGDGMQPSLWQGVPIKMEKSTIGVLPGHNRDSNVREGEVARVTASFTEPHKSIMKAVRPNHVQSDEHWKQNWRPMHEWRPL